MSICIFALGILAIAAFSITVTIISLNRFQEIQERRNALVLLRNAIGLYCEANKDSAEVITLWKDECSWRMRLLPYLARSLDSDDPDVLHLRDLLISKDIDIRNNIELDDLVDRIGIFGSQTRGYGIFKIAESEKSRSNLVEQQLDLSSTLSDTSPILLLVSVNSYHWKTTCGIANLTDGQVAFPSSTQVIALDDRSLILTQNGIITSISER